MIMNGYQVEIFFPLEDRFLWLVGRAKEFAAGVLGEDDVEFEFVDDFFDFVMDVFELAVPKFGYFGFVSGLVSDFQDVRYLTTDSSLVGNYLWLEVHGRGIGV